jgi:hypothetical protein
MIEVEKNFEWKDTDREIMVFIPSYGNQELVEYSIRRIKATDIGKYSFCIVIGNDNKHVDWSYLNSDNMLVYYFTLHHDAEQPRNGAFIRNYALKRCQAKYFLQKDGEVVIEGAFLNHAMMACKQGYLWRPGQIYVLDETNSKQYMRQHHLRTGVEFNIQKRIEPVKPIDVLTTKQHIMAINGDISFTSFYHYAYCASTIELKSMHGYDEDYKYYGFEDTDMFCRLTSMKKTFEIDYDCKAVHLWHPSTVNAEQIMTMGKLFKSKNPSLTIRNESSWGTGI